jgi:hypothetical protein
MYTEIQDYLNEEGLSLTVEDDRIVGRDKEVRVVFSFKDVCNVYYFYEHTAVSSSSISETGEIHDWKGLYLAAKAKASNDQYVDYMRMEQLQWEAGQQTALH